MKVVQVQRGCLSCLILFVNTLSSVLILLKIIFEILKRLQISIIPATNIINVIRNK